MTSPTETYTVLIDLHTPDQRKTHKARIARAIARVITLATETDIEGAEILDDNIGQVTVRTDDEPHRDRLALVYQCGIANVFHISPLGSPRRIMQGDFRTCETYAAGLRDGSRRQLDTYHCDVAGDVAGRMKEWIPGGTQMFPDAAHTPSRDPRQVYI